MRINRWKSAQGKGLHVRPGLRMMAKVPSLPREHDGRNAITPQHIRKGRSHKMGTAFSCGRKSRWLKPFGPGAGRQRLPGVQRAAPWPGIQRAVPVGRVQGGNACADAREDLAGNPKGSARGPGAGWQRLRRCKGRPCPESRGGAPWPSEVSKAQRPGGFDTLYWVLPVENGCPSGKRNPPQEPQLPQQH